MPYLVHLKIALAGEKAQTVDAGFDDLLIFVLRIALLLPTLTAAAVSSAADWIQIVARILGPLLIGLFAFGLRARVQR